MSEEDSTGNGQNVEEQEWKTILYCFTREALRTEDIEKVNEALSQEGFKMKSTDGGDKIQILREKEVGSSVDVSSVLDS